MNEAARKKIEAKSPQFSWNLCCLYNFYSFRISNGNIDLVSQKIKNGSPIFSGRFHADIKTGFFKKPLFEMLDVAVENRKRFLGKKAGHHCGIGKGFMDIYVTAGKISIFHGNQFLS